MTNILYPEDYKFGIQQEEKVVNILRDYFGRDIKRSEDNFSKHDYYDELYTYEMKSRKNAYSRYPTTMITQDKIITQENKKLILLFNFTDGLYFIEYDQEKFKKYKTDLFSRANLVWNQKPHVYIDIADLTKVSFETKSPA
ncbi:MAG: hypothetical protein EBU90_21980 [Proteobacteria bacterium]|nr:hypothetical protein [Pseudomonadota bacterium]NBP15998.1 hypothetical protein [bacterium]